MQIEIGGGTRHRGAPWVNVDLCETADIVHDLNMTPWPLENESVDAVYTSHCIEHVNCPHTFIREICRICRVGATVEIRCPDPMSEMAMTAGHRHVFSINMVRHMDIFPDLFWTGRLRRLRHVRTESGPDDYWFPLARANPIFAKYTDKDLLNWVPRTRHENCFHFVVEEMP